MNLFTNYLKQRNQNKQLAEFIAHWDQLEVMVITVFKSGEATEQDEQLYGDLRRWLGINYPQWQQQLAEIWPDVLVGGEPAAEDPFLRLFSHPHSADFVGDWVAMQNLAGAREALNRMVVRQ